MRPHSHSNTSQRETKISPLLRDNKAAIIFNSIGQVLCGKRSDFPNESIWQLPQGGKEAHEEPVQAILREIEEETGINRDQLTLLPPEDQLGETYRYLYPFQKDGVQYDGQKQQYFVFKFNGGFEIPAKNPETEFSQISWKSWEELIQQTLASRVFIYEDIKKKSKPIIKKYMASASKDVR
jgi:putative (di)nucleoside polyphosphate hydrolase